MLPFWICCNVASYSRAVQFQSSHLFCFHSLILSLPQPAIETALAEKKETQTKRNKHFCRLGFAGTDTVINTTMSMGKRSSSTKFKKQITPRTGVPQSTKIHETPAQRSSASPEKLLGSNWYKFYSSLLD